MMDEKNNVIGINLGFDFCAEHEWGIKDLQEDFGIKIGGRKLGFEARRNTKVPEGLTYSKKDNALIYTPFPSTDARLEHIIKHTMIFDEKREEIGSAWSDESFGVKAIGEHAWIIKELYDAFQNKNGVIMLSGRSNPFANSGLILLDYETIPNDYKKRFRDDERKYLQEQKTFRKLEQESGVYELLEKNNKRFFFLKIKQFDDEGKPQWWLNPFDQDKYKAGWYTTEDLKKWAEDKGPVIDRRKRR